MRCRPGDIAIILKNSPYQIFKSAGRFVDVLYAAPVGEHKAPDGTRLVTSETDAWVIKFAMPMPTVRNDGGYNITAYATCPDRYLQPIRPGEEDADLVAELNRPQELELVEK